MTILFFLTICVLIFSQSTANSTHPCSNKRALDHVKDSLTEMFYADHVKYLNDEQAILDALGLTYETRSVGRTKIINGLQNNGRIRSLFKLSCTYSFTYDFTVICSFTDDTVMMLRPADIRLTESGYVDFAPGVALVNALIQIEGCPKLRPLEALQTVDFLMDCYAQIAGTSTRLDHWTSVLYYYLLQRGAERNFTHEQDSGVFVPEMATVINHLMDSSLESLRYSFGSETLQRVDSDSDTVVIRASYLSRDNKIESIWLRYSDCEFTLDSQSTYGSGFPVETSRP